MNINIQSGVVLKLAPNESNILAKCINKITGNILLTVDSPVSIKDYRAISNSFPAILFLGDKFIPFEDSNTLSAVLSLLGGGDYIMKELLQALSLSQVCNIGTQLGKFNEFVYCTNITSINGIGFASTFPNLTELTLPTNCTTLYGMRAFSGKYNMHKLVTPLAMTTFGGYDMCYNSTIDELWLYNPVPMSSVGTGMLDAGLNRIGHIYIPIGSLPSYKAANGWNYYTRYIEFDPTEITYPETE